jgi:hypothetical protein
MDNSLETENLFTELVAFIRKQIGEYDMPIERDTLIEDDLGVTGDEAYELLAAFSIRYNVDISGLNFEKYFYDEPGIFNLQNRKVEPFAVGYLEKAMLTGRLDEEVIGSR